MLTGHQRVALLRAGITVEACGDDTILFIGECAMFCAVERDDGLHDPYSGYGEPVAVDRLRSAVREIVDLKCWTPPSC